MKVSILCASYNRADTLEEMIVSALRQDYEDIELVIVDGGSSDGSVKILEKFADRIKFVSEPDDGLYHALNKALKIASGDIIGVIGADDFYPTADAVSTVVDSFVKHDVSAVYGGKKYVLAADKTKIIRSWPAKRYSVNEWNFGFMPPHLGFFVKKQIYDTFGYFRTDLSLSADYELMLRFLFKHRISCMAIDKTIVHMRVGGLSTASWSNRILAHREDRLAWRLNDLNPKWYTLWLKPLRKCFQWVCV